ncbi:MAG: BatD family protein [Chitinophagales bacterium]
MITTKPILQNKAALRAALLLLLWVCSAVAFAQVQFSLTGPSSVPVNQSFQIDFKLNGAIRGGIKTPAFTDFTVVSGPNPFTEQMNINGKKSEAITFSYVLKPKKEGTFKIGKASIAIDGVTMESNELTVTVTKAVAQQQRQQAQRQYDPYDPFGMMQDPFQDPFFQQQQPQEYSKEELQKRFKDDFIIRLELSKNSVYKGEMLTATYKLYYRQNMAGFNVTKAPSFDGFWSQEVELDPKRKQKIETLNGKQYHTAEILQYNLYPQRAGALSVSPIEAVANLQVMLGSRNPFDVFGGGVQPFDMELKTNQATLEVKDLPEQDKPSDYSGAVGKYSFETNLSTKEVKTDEPVTYTMKISGSGNLKMVEAPAVNFPKEFEAYDPKVKENITNSAIGMNGSKQYDFLLVPRQPGDYTIQPQSFSFFDPASGKYVTIKSPEYALKVTGEPKQTTTVTTEELKRKDVVVLGKDIRYIKTNTPDFSGDTLFGTAGFVAAYGTPVLLFLALVAVKRRNDSLAADVIGTKRRRALKQAKARLTVAEKYLAANDKNNFYNEVSRSVWGYLGDKLTMDMAALSKDNVEEKLLAKGVSADLIGKLKDLINTCEIALYSPVGEGGQMKQNYDVAMNLMADLENEIKK